jgi:hypothetical protein
VGRDLYEELKTFLQSNCRSLVLVRILLSIQCRRVGHNIQLLRLCSLFLPPQKSTTIAKSNILQFFVGEWEWYTKAAKFTNVIFQYLNQHWIPKEMERDPNAGIYKIYDVRQFP